MKLVTEMHIVGDDGVTITKRCYTLTEFSQEQCNEYITLVSEAFFDSVTTLLAVMTTKKWLRNNNIDPNKLKG